MDIFHQWEQLCLRSRSLLVLNWKQNVEIANVIQSIEKVWYVQEPKAEYDLASDAEKECFSLSALYASHHPDAVYVTHLETRT
jgi:hypothetical protein